MWNKIITIGKTVGTAVLGLIKNITGGKWTNIIKAGTFVGVAIGAAIGVGKVQKAASDLFEKEDRDNMDTESLLYTGLRLSPDDFKGSRMHPSMEAIEEFNRTIDDNIRREFSGRNEEDKKFIKKLQKRKKEEEKKRHHKKYANAPKINLSEIDFSKDILEFFTEFYNKEIDFDLQPLMAN